MAATVAYAVTTDFATEAGRAADCFGSTAAVVAIDVDHARGDCMAGGTFAATAVEGVTSVLAEADGLDGWDTDGFGSAADGVLLVHT